MKRVVLAVLVLAALPVAINRANAFNPLAPWPLCTARSQPIQIGVSQVATATVDSRIEDITLASKAMQMNVHVDVLVPPGYATQPTARYPVLYLLHGALGSYKDWPAHGVEDIIGKLPMIVVMPDDGEGSYSDWYGNEFPFSGPVPAWESFHTRELIPWIDAHFRTIGTAAARYIAGLSSGGGGTMKYATANPGLFGAAGVFSGAVDTDLPGYYGTSDVTFDLSYIPGLGPPAHCTWGDPSSEQVVWEDNDPTYKAVNLTGTRLFLACGTGRPGPYDSPYSTSDVVEETVWSMNKAFAGALTAAHVPFTSMFYGPGTHSWPYWERDLRQFLVWLHPVPPEALATPPAFDLRSAGPQFSAWGWTFTVSRAVREFVYLSNVGVRGLTAAGSGQLAVISPPSYVPGARYWINQKPQTAGADHRLRFAIDLGPSHTAQQTQFGAAPPAGWDRVNVTIGGPS